MALFCEGGKTLYYIGVIGAADCTPEVYRLAEEVGREVAKKGVDIKNPRGENIIPLAKQAEEAVEMILSLAGEGRVGNGDAG